MPSCMCGNFFSTNSYNINNKEDDLCSRCKDASTPKSYTASHEWVGENSSNLIFNSNTLSSGSSE